MFYPRIVGNNRNATCQHLSPGSNYIKMLTTNPMWPSTPSDAKPMRAPNYSKHSDAASKNKEKSIFEKQSSLFCQTHKLWFPKRDAVHGLYTIFEILQVFENQPLRLAR
jgi:hypothetical protein